MNEISNLFTRLDELAELITEKKLGNDLILVGSAALAVELRGVTIPVHDLDILVGPKSHKAVKEAGFTARTNDNDKEYIGGSIIEDFVKREDYFHIFPSGNKVDFQMKPFRTMELWDESYSSIKESSREYKKLAGGVFSVVFNVAHPYHCLAMKFRTHPQREKDKQMLLTLFKPLLLFNDIKHTSAGGWIK